MARWRPRWRMGAAFLPLRLGPGVLVGVVGPLGSKADPQLGSMDVQHITRRMIVQVASSSQWPSARPR